MRPIIGIVYDTREQSAALASHAGTPATYRRHGLAIGDYALEQDCTDVGGELYAVRFAIERKGIADFVASFSDPRRRGRENNKIQRSKDAGFALHYVVAGGTESAYAMYETQMRRNGISVWTRREMMECVSQLMARKVPVVLCDHERAAAEWIVAILANRARVLNLGGAR